MQLLTNSIDTETVREETRNGREYIVADVTVARPMGLNGGYVDDEAFAESVPGWNHVPLPIGHPVDVHGNYITARIPEVIDNAVTGSLYYADYDHNERDLNGSLYVDVEQTEALGSYGERVLEILKNGEELEVSSAYRGEPGEPGMYEGVDGESYREEVTTNLRPDHVALLPDELGPGKCSCEDGCGVAPSEGLAESADGPVANTFGVSGHTPSPDGPEGVPGAGLCVNGEAGTSADRVYVNMRSDGSGRERPSSSTNGTNAEVQSQHQYQYNALSQARDPSYEDTESSSWGDVSKTFENFYGGYPDSSEDVSSWSDVSQDARQWIASKSLLGDPNADSWDEGLVHPVVNPSTNSLNEGALDAILGSRGESADVSQDAIDSSQSKARSLLESEFGRDLDSNSNTDTNANTNTDSNDMNINQTEGDRVRWESSNGNWRYGIVADEAEDSDEVEDDEILVAVYVNEEDGWTRSDEEATVKEENLEEIDEFPSEAMSSNADAAEAEEALGTLQSILQRVGLAGNSAAESIDDTDSNGGDTDANTACDCDSGSGTHEGCQCTETNANDDANDDAETTTTNTNTMTDFSDDDYERIANATSFGTEQLREMEDDQLESLNSLVKNANAAGDEGEGGEGSEPDANADPESTGGGEAAEGDGGEEDVEVNDSLPEEVQNTLEELSSTVEAQQEVIEQLNANREEEEQRERNKAAKTIQANSDQYTEEQLEAMDTDLLKTTANALSQSNNATDYGGLSEPFPASVDANEDEESESTSSGGSFRQFLANKESEASD